MNPKPTPQNRCVDLMEMTTLGEYNLETGGPLIMLPGCKHVFTVLHPIVWGGGGVSASLHGPAPLVNIATPLNVWV